MNIPKSVTDKRFDELRHNVNFKSRIKQVINDYTDMYDDWTDVGVAVELTWRDVQINQLQARIKELESDKHVNEIKAQGIADFIEMETEKSIRSGDNKIFRSYVMVRRRLCVYLNKLRANHE